MVLKRTRKGRTFYGCSRYPDCKFASWTKPKSDNPEPVIAKAEGAAGSEVNEVRTDALKQS